MSSTVNGGFPNLSNVAQNTNVTTSESAINAAANAANITNTPTVVTTRPTVTNAPALATTAQTVTNAPALATTRPTVINAPALATTRPTVINAPSVVTRSPSAAIPAPISSPSANVSSSTNNNFVYAGTPSSNQSQNTGNFDMSSIFSVQEKYLLDLSNSYPNVNDAPRIAMYVNELQNQMSDLSDRFNTANTSSTSILDSQQNMLNIVNEEYDRLESKKQLIDSVDAQQHRVTLLNDTYRKKYAQYTKMTIVVVIGLLIHVFLTWMSDYLSIIPFAVFVLLDMVNIIVCLIVITNLYSDMMSRDKIDYDKLDLPPPLRDLNTNSSSSFATAPAPSSGSGTFCVGQVCCDTVHGAIWDPVTMRCIAPQVPQIVIPTQPVVIAPTQPPAPAPAVSIGQSAPPQFNSANMNTGLISSPSSNSPYNLNNVTNLFDQATNIMNLMKESFDTMQTEPELQFNDENTSPMHLLPRAGGKMQTSTIPENSPHEYSQYNPL